MLSNNFFGFVSQGSSGGGGVINKGLSISGEGTLASPFFNNTCLPTDGINLDSGSVTIDSGGKVFYVYGENNTIYLDNANFLPNQLLRIVNKQAPDSVSITILPNDIGSNIYYQGTNIVVDNIPRNMVYDFVYDNYSNNWYCLPNSTINLFDYVLDGNDITITQNGFHRISTSVSPQSCNLEFPNPQDFQGQMIYIYNLEVISISVISGTYGRPRYPDLGQFTNIDPNSTYKFISNGTTWYVISQYSS